VNRCYVTADVFTDRIFGGNPLAVVLDAEGLSTAQMQAIATEFNYSETTFVLPPREIDHTAHVHIFTARVEVPFAGHPNIGTAVVLARELEGKGNPPIDRFVFEEATGLVTILPSGGCVRVFVRSDRSQFVAMVLRISSLLPFHWMGIVEPNQAFTVRSVQRERVVDAVRLFG
jgi:predicted PhzF superfamily epimerase YddE/YHI9